MVVIVGAEAQVAELNRKLPDLHVPEHPVLVIGSGKVGFAAARALKRKNIRVHVLDRDRPALERLEGVADAIFVGDAADRQILTKAGLARAPTVLLTSRKQAIPRAQSAQQITAG